jgi:hypothetical protein
MPRRRINAPPRYQVRIAGNSDGQLPARRPATQILRVARQDLSRLTFRRVPAISTSAGAQRTTPEMANSSSMEELVRTPEVIGLVRSTQRAPATAAAVPRPERLGAAQRK